MLVVVSVGTADWCHRNVHYLTLCLRNVSSTPTRACVFQKKVCILKADIVFFLVHYFLNIFTAEISMLTEAWDTGEEKTEMSERKKWNCIGMGTWSICSKTYEEMAWAFVER